MTQLAGKRARLESEMAEAVRKARAVMTTAENENRELTSEERAKVEEHLAESRTLKAQIDHIDADAIIRAEIEHLNPPAPATAPGQASGERRPRTMGEAFVQSESLRAAIATGSHRQALPGFSVQPIEFRAATLTEDAASGGDLITPDVRQGIIPLLQRRILVTDLLMPGTTGANSIDYLVETTFTNAAAARTEATGAAAESTLIFDRVNEPVRSIAHFLPVTAEMLEDYPALQSYVDGRLALGLNLSEENELLNGAAATPPHIVGLLNRANKHADQARGADTNADAILKQVLAILADAYIMPDGVVVHPTNWQTIVLSKDGNGVYYGQGPFSAMQTPVLWGLPAAVTPVIASGTALAGAFRSCAQRFVRRGVTISASNSHSDYFTKRLVAVMAEMREALAVYRPGAFGKVTGLN